MPRTSRPHRAGFTLLELVIVLMIIAAAQFLPGVAILAFVGIWVLGYVLIALVSSALQGVYTAALYRYAMTGEAGYFAPEIMGNAFRPKM